MKRRKSHKSSRFHGLLVISLLVETVTTSPTLRTCPPEGFYLPDPCELTFANTLLLSNAAISLGNTFISLEISSQFFIFFSLLSFILAWTFLSLQIKEFLILGFSINDSVYSCLFFFLTGLHFFHLILGLLLCCLFFCNCSFGNLFLYLLFCNLLFCNLLFNGQISGSHSSSNSSLIHSCDLWDVLPLLY